jgi:hypothetical protein
MCFPSEKVDFEKLTERVRARMSPTPLAAAEIDRLRETLPEIFAPTLRGANAFTVNRS